MRKSQGSFIGIAGALLLALACVLPHGAAAAENDPAARFGQADTGSEVVLRALGMLGVPYLYGGDSPDTGFDCSGLVQYVYGDALGASLPRRSQEIESAGTAIATDDLQPGDLVFFNTQRSPFSHVGIYIGEQRFVHAPSSGGTVRIESLAAGYWQSRFDGARRLLASGSAGPVLATRPAASEAEALALLAIQGEVLGSSFLR